MSDLYRSMNRENRLLTCRWTSWVRERTGYSSRLPEKSISPFRRIYGIHFKVIKKNWNKYWYWSHDGAYCIRVHQSAWASITKISYSVKILLFPSPTGYMFRLEFKLKWRDQCPRGGFCKTDVRNIQMLNLIVCRQWQCIPLSKSADLRVWALYGHFKKDHLQIYIWVVPIWQGGLCS